MAVPLGAQPAAPAGSDQPSDGLWNLRSGPAPTCRNERSRRDARSRPLHAPADGAKAVRAHRRGEVVEKPSGAGRPAIKLIPTPLAVERGVPARRCGTAAGAAARGCEPPGRASTQSVPGVQAGRPVNKEKSGGGKKSGSGRGKEAFPVDMPSCRALATLPASLTSLRR